LGAYFNLSAWPTAEIIDPGLGELDKVRNILFGRQAKANEDRLESMERSLTKMISEMNERVSARLDDIEQQLIQKESVLQSAVDDAEATSLQSFADVRSDLDDMAAAFGTDLAQLKADLNKALDQSNSQLSEDKTDRKALAMMFDEMSMRLRGDDS